MKTLLHSILNVSLRIKITAQEISINTKDVSSVRLAIVAVVYPKHILGIIF
jgi:hypothetical protein